MGHIGRREIYKIFIKIPRFFIKFYVFGELLRFLVLYTIYIEMVKDVPINPRWARRVFDGYYILYI